jgi:hypothetical protein
LVDLPHLILDSELLKPIRAVLQLSLKSMVKDADQGKKDDRSHKRYPAQRNISSKNHRGKSTKPKGPSGEVSAE